MSLSCLDMYIYGVFKHVLIRFMIPLLSKIQFVSYSCICNYGWLHTKVDVEATGTNGSRNFDCTQRWMWKLLAPMVLGTLIENDFFPSEDVTVI